LGLIFFPIKKKPKYGRSTGKLTYEPENIKHVCWCMDNGISISVVPDWDKGLTSWMVSIKIKDTVSTDPADYTDEEALRKMYKYYEYYYNKYNENKI
jgi:hypothetical protein|tara:strand:+ start:46 stop:336 length:291 start_codon:yes stop_codon:yes gene_type:complete